MINMNDFSSLSSNALNSLHHGRHYMQHKLQRRPRSIMTASYTWFYVDLLQGRLVLKSDHVLTLNFKMKNEFSFNFFAFELLVKEHL